MSKLIESEFICANPNSTLKCMDYLKEYKCLAYCSNNLIHIYNPETFKTYLTLNAHSDRINTLKWMKSNKSNIKNDLIELISCGSDKKIIHWININKNIFDYSSWKIEKIYFSSDKSENVSINIIETLFISHIEKYFVIFTSNGILDLFYYDIDLKEYKLFNSMNLSKNLLDCVCLTILNDEYLLLLTGGYDRKINIYSVMRIKKIIKLLNNKIDNICTTNFLVSLIGHENDIRDIQFISPFTHDSNKYFFCSCSQDSYIRIWNMQKLSNEDSLIKNLNINNNNNDISNESNIFDEYKSKTSYIIKIEKDNNNIEYYNITLESILSGHEDAISSVQWCKIEEKEEDKNTEKWCILSSSFDFSVGIWIFDKKYNIWNKEYSLGEMLGNKHAFYYASFLNNYKEIIAYAFNGSFYYWKFNEESKNFEDEVIIHGHFNTVSDIKWDNTKNILFSTSHDETTRAYIYWKKNKTWHEINRPQIHGYPINTIIVQNLNTENEKNILCNIITGSEEKILRIFSPPFNLIKYLKELSEIDIKFKPDNSNEFYEKKYSNIEGTKQALGLLNKQVILNNEDESDFSKFDPDSLLTNKTEQIYLSKYNYNKPPNEDFLSNNTLWPEEYKLYGHGNELFNADISNNNKFIASSQKSSNVKNSNLYLWNLKEKKLIKQIEGNTLTIVQIEFSHNDKYILTGGRDRSVNIYVFEENEYKLMQNIKNAHKRIIWSVSFSLDDKYFITGSRDKSIKIWINNNNKFEEKCKFEFNEEVTAVEFVDKIINNNIYIFLIGFENGEIKIGSFNENEIKIIYEFDKFISCGKAVKRIKSVLIENENIIRIAVCSEDFTVRIFKLDLNVLNEILSN